MLLGKRYKQIQEVGTAVIGRGGLFEITGDGFLANCTPDLATIEHVLRRKEEFGDFLLDQARGKAVIRIEAPLVTSGDFEQGCRSYYKLKCVARQGILEITVDYYPLLDRALFRFFTPLEQGRWMKRAGYDTHEGNTAKVSEACGITFKGGKGVVGVNQLPHIMRVLLGSDGGFPTEFDRGDSTGLYTVRADYDTYTIRADYDTPATRGSFHFRDSNHDGVYSSFVSLRAHAPYQIAKCLDSISGFIVP